MELIKDDRFNLGSVDFKLFINDGLKNIVRDATAEKNYGFFLRLYLYMFIERESYKDKKVEEQKKHEEEIKKDESLFEPVFEDLKK